MFTLLSGDLVFMLLYWHHRHGHEGHALQHQLRLHLSKRCDSRWRRPTHITLVVGEHVQDHGRWRQATEQKPFTEPGGLRQQQHASMNFQHVLATQSGCTIVRDAEHDRLSLPLLAKMTGRRRALKCYPAVASITMLSAARSIKALSDQKTLLPVCCKVSESFVKTENRTGRQLSQNPASSFVRNMCAPEKKE